MNRFGEEFELEPGITYLNHASFGAPTVVALSRAEAERRDLERDTAERLGPELVARLADQAAHLAPFIGTGDGVLTLVQNSTEANAAVAMSWPLAAEDHVLLLDLEYPSVIRAWQLAGARAGATVDVVGLGLPVTIDRVLEIVAAAHPATRVLVLSAVTSATATAMPVTAVGEICRQHGIELVLDAAHVVGHVEVDLVETGAATAFGSLHKWLPVGRSVGFLWVAEHLRHAIRPAAVSLTWDSADLVERFSWRGTWDPATALGLADALAQHDTWRRAGRLASAVATADALTSALTGRGLTPTAEDQLLPPRLRGFVAHGIELDELREALLTLDVRAWTGTADGSTILRVATHVYNDLDDVAAIERAVDLARHG